MLAQFVCHILATLKWPLHQPVTTNVSRAYWMLSRQEKQQPPQVDINTLRPRHNGRHFADDIFKRIFLNEDILILIKISLKFVPKGSINNIAALVQIMAWRRPGDKPLSEAMMVNLPTHICITRPQWVNPLMPGSRLKINCNLKFNICFYH